MQTTNPSQETAKPKRTLIRRILFSFLLVTFLLVTLFAIGEIAIRCFFKPLPGVHTCITFVEDKRHYVLKPNNSFQFEGAYEPLPKPVSWETNAAGERASNSASQMSTNSSLIQIATFGDSETFGWGVNLEETFQKRMEQQDNRLQVSNFGVPGYHVCQIAEHIQKTKYAPQPNFLIYVVNPNDFDISLTFKVYPKSSELLRRLIIIYYMLKEKGAMKLRRSELVTNTFANELVNMKRFCEQNGIEFILVFLNWEDRYVLESNQELKTYFYNAESYNRRVIDCSYVYGLPEIDDHFTKKTHLILADLMLQHFHDHNYLPKAVSEQTHFVKR